MKKVLLVSLLAIAGVSVSAQNLIKNEKFATEVTNKVTNPNKATAGEWFIMNNEADGVTTIAWEQTGDAKYPNAMKIDNSGAEKNTSWYKAFLGQRITDGLEKGIYVLTFYAKAKEAGTPVSVYIKQTNEEKNDNGKLNTTFFMRRDYDADAQPNACFPGVQGGVPADPGPASGRPGIWRRHKASDIRSCQSGISDGGGL